VIDSGRAVAEVAADHGVAWWTVQATVNAAVVLLPAVDDLHVRRLGIDEHRYRSVRWFRDDDGRWRRVEPWMSTIVNADCGQVLGSSTAATPSPWRSGTLDKSQSPARKGIPPLRHAQPAQLIGGSGLRTPRQQSTSLGSAGEVGHGTRQRPSPTRRSSTTPRRPNAGGACPGPSAGLHRQRRHCLQMSRRWNRCKPRLEAREALVN